MDASQEVLMSVAETPLTSPRHDVPDALAAIEFYYRQGWTDGLPVVPPTEERVREFLEVTGHAPADVVGTVPQRSTTITAEKVAINAVMAGCLPEYFPVVVAAVEALCDDRFNAHGSMASTAGAAPLIVVNGPIVPRIELNSGDGVFGPGWRANATIGRSLRLVLMNVLRAQPGVMDKAALGHPGKYTYCIAENEADSPWEPLHVERGLRRDQSAVTVFAAEAPHYVMNGGASSAEQICASLLDTLTANLPRNAHILVVICPEHLQVFQRDGWSKQDLRTYLAEHAQRSVASAKRAGWLKGEPTPDDESQQLRWFSGPDKVLVVVAGGKTAAVSAVLPPWMGGAGSDPITRAIRE
jgi:hypothetical protein